MKELLVIIFDLGLGEGIIRTIYTYVLFVKSVGNRGLYETTFLYAAVTEADFRKKALSAAYCGLFSA